LGAKASATFYQRPHKKRRIGRSLGQSRHEVPVPPGAKRHIHPLFSLFSTPSSTLDMDNPDVVADFVRAHLVRGFANERPRPRRGQWPQL